MSMHLVFAASQRNSAEAGEMNEESWRAYYITCTQKLAKFKTILGIGIKPSKVGCKEWGSN